MFGMWNYMQLTKANQPHKECNHLNLYTCILAFKVYCAVLVWKHPNAILTHYKGAIEFCSDSNCCSWCNKSCHHLSNCKLKWGIRDHSALTTRKKCPSDAKGRNLPLMCKRGHCTGECHSFPGHGLSTLDCNWAPETKGGTHYILVSVTEVWSFCITLT